MMKIEEYQYLNTSKAIEDFGRSLPPRTPRTAGWMHRVMAIAATEAEAREQWDRMARGQEPPRPKRRWS